MNSLFSIDYLFDDFYKNTLTIDDNPALFKILSFYYSIFPFEDFAKHNKLTVDYFVFDRNVIKKIEFNNLKENEEDFLKKALDHHFLFLK